MRSLTPKRNPYGMLKSFKGCGMQGSRFAERLTPVLQMSKVTRALNQHFYTTLIIVFNVTNPHCLAQY